MNVTYTRPLARDVHGKLFVAVFCPCEPAAGLAACAGGYLASTFPAVSVYKPSICKQMFPFAAHVIKRAPILLLDI
jgi:hypothetical protein